MSVDLHDLAAPPARPRFREELWERAEAAERRSARRWRATALTAIAAAVAATSAAGVFAVRGGAAFTGTYDRTMSCPVTVQGGIPVARLQAHSTYSTVTFGQKLSLASNAALLDSAGHSLGGVSAVRLGYGFPADGSCKPAARVPLAPSGLPLYDVYKPGDAGLGSMDNGAMCFVGAHVRVRVQAAVGSDRASSGRLALWTGTKKLRPVAYVDWAPKRVAVYLSDDCHA